MKKYIVTFSFLIIASLGFSQTTIVSKDKQTSATKVEKGSDVQSKKVATIKGYQSTGLNQKLNGKTSEGTNDPLLNGYEKKTINGKEVYVKKNNKITVVYEPK